MSVERNVHYNNSGSSAPRIEGENDTLIEMMADSHKDTVPTVPLNVPTIIEPPTAPTTPPECQQEEFIAYKCIQKPSQRVLNILETNSTLPLWHSNPHQHATPRNNNTTIVLEGEGQSNWMMNVDFHDEYILAAEMSDAEVLEPCTLAEAKWRPNWTLWETAIHEELDTLRKGTWELAEAPPGANIIRSKWVFRAKKDAARNVVHYKAHLVAQGFSQVPSVDYFDTFAPVAKLASIQSVLAIAAAENLELHQIDIKGAYLNGELTN